MTRCTSVPSTAFGSAIRSSGPIAVPVFSPRVDAASPEHPANDLETAIALFKAQRREEARPIFEKVLAAAPNNPEPHYYLAVIAAMKDDWQKAIPYAEKSVEIEPNNAEYQFGLGQACGLAALKSGVLSKYGYAKRCRAAYERAVELAPAFAARRPAAFLVRGRSCTPPPSGSERATR